MQPILTNTKQTWRLPRWLEYIILFTTMSQSKCMMLGTVLLKSALPNNAQTFIFMTTMKVNIPSSCILGCFSLLHLISIWSNILLSFRTVSCMILTLSNYVVYLQTPPYLSWFFWQEMISNDLSLITRLYSSFFPRMNWTIFDRTLY